MESASTLFNSLIRTNNNKHVEASYFHCDGAIVKDININSDYRTTVSFVGESKLFSYFGILDPEKYVQHKVNITYKRVIADSYSYFWITSIELSEDTINYQSNSELFIPCYNCKKKIALKKFQQCEGIIVKNNWNKPECMICHSLYGGSIGHRCKREKVNCMNCNKIQQI